MYNIEKNGCLYFRMEKIMRDVNSLREARAIQVKKEKTRLLLIAAIIIIVVSIISFSFLSSAKEISSSNDGFHYESILIESGDSLWSIVKAYDLDSYISTQDAIDNLMQLNNITNTTIYEGEYLIIFCSNN